MKRSKLTLSVDPKVVARARRFTRQHQTSISRLVGQYLASLGAEPTRALEAPTVERLRGILPAKVDRAEYRAYLDRRYRV